MPAGKYRHKIKLLAPQVPSINDAGEATTATRPAWQTHAKISTQTGREIIRNGVIEAEITYLIEMRYRSDINEQWQIEHDGKTLAISKCIDPDQMKTELQIIASEVR
jgi:SPP1 family predicted phage head-tail adaptor